MTRFARAKGSKSSNEKKAEEPTSWLEMKRAMVSKKSAPSKCVETKEVEKIEPQPRETEWASLGHDPPLLLQHHGSKENSSTENQVNGTTMKKKRKKNLDAINDSNEVVKKKKQKTQTAANTSQGEQDISLGESKKKGKKRKPMEMSTEDLKDPTVKKKKKEMDDSDKKNFKVKSKEKKVGKVNDNEIKKKFNKDKKFKSFGAENLGKKSFKDQKKHFSGKKGQTFEKGFNKKFKDKRNFQNNENKFTKSKSNQSVIDEIIVNGEKIPIVKFQGFPVTLEEAERLKKLRSDLIKQGVPKSELEGVIKLERRRAEKALSRLKKSVCFHCRGSGHLLSNCPELTQKENTSTGICYKCGSTEHSALECKVVKGTNFQFAECFICKEQGHIARQCPDNPRGLYPQGGACRECGDVTHLRKDCPQVLSKKSEEIITVGLRNDRNLECLEEEIVNKEKENSKDKIKKKPTVKF